MHVLDPFGWPLLNTLILLCSGCTVTWAHHALINGHRDGLIKGLWLTIALGMLFTSIQAYEYAHAPFGFKDNIYTSAFFMATGFHGFHVIIGTIFLTVCLVRAYKGHFSPRQHFGFEAAAWYWHFVDVVWLFLFLCVYVWGGWGAEYHADARWQAAGDRTARPPPAACCDCAASAPAAATGRCSPASPPSRRAAAPAGSISPASTSATGRRPS